MMCACCVRAVCGVKDGRCQLEREARRVERDASCCCGIWTEREEESVCASEKKSVR